MAGFMGSGLQNDDSPGALSNAFAAALGSGYIPPGGATTALPLGPATGPSFNYQGITACEITDRHATMTDYVDRLN